MKSRLLPVFCPKAIVIILIISMMANAPWKVACPAPGQAQALQSVKSQVAATAPTPESKALNCLNPNDTEALRPEAKIKGGALNQKAVSLPQPASPPLLRVSQMSGTVAVEVVVDALEGKVVWARAVSGHPLLRWPSTLAACRARFAPTIYTGPPIRVSGILIYSFPPAQKARPAASKKRTSGRRTRPL